MTGKEKCKILKEIRNRIAYENGIDFASSECTYEGECRGYCPKCDSEVRFLENALKEKASKKGDINLDSLLDVSVFDIDDWFDEVVDGELDFDDEILGDMMVNDNITLSDEEMEAIIREYVVLPNKDDEITDVQGLLGDITPNDFNDVW